jgi:hypothetical protein
MSTERWRFTLIDENQVQPHAAHRASGRGPHPEDVGERAAAALLAASELLGLRGEGPEPWTASPSNDPIAFLLDGVADAVSLWRGDSAMYRNRAAERMGLPRGDTPMPERFEASGRALERRCLHFRRGDADYLLEIISEVR